VHCCPSFQSNPTERKPYGTQCCAFEDGLPTVTIVGAGPLGRRLALNAARAGCRVLLEEVIPSNLHHAREALSQQFGQEALPNVTSVSDIGDAVRESDLRIDCAPDELESKL